MMRKIFLTVLVGISSLSIHASDTLKEWEDNQVTGINRGRRQSYILVLSDSRSCSNRRILPLSL